MKYEKILDSSLDTIVSMKKEKRVRYHEIMTVIIALIDVDELTSNDFKETVVKAHEKDGFDGVMRVIQEIHNGMDWFDAGDLIEFLNEFEEVPDTV